MTHPAVRAYTKAVASGKMSEVSKDLPDFVEVQNILEGLSEHQSYQVLGTSLGTDDGMISPFLKKSGGIITEWRSDEGQGRSGGGTIRSNSNGLEIALRNDENEETKFFVMPEESLSA